MSHLDKGTQCCIQKPYDNKGNIGWAENANEKDNGRPDLGEIHGDFKSAVPG